MKEYLWSLLIIFGIGFLVFGALAIPLLISEKDKENKMEICVEVYGNEKLTISTYDKFDELCKFLTEEGELRYFKLKESDIKYEND